MLQIPTSACDKYVSDFCDLVKANHFDSIHAKTIVYCSLILGVTSDFRIRKEQFKIKFAPSQFSLYWYRLIQLWGSMDVIIKRNLNGKSRAE